MSTVITPDGTPRSTRLNYITSLVINVSFRDFRWRLSCKGDCLFLQAECDGICSDTGAPLVLRGRKFYISDFATADEIVKTCWVAVEMFLRHEAMEDFKFKGQPIFNPHTKSESLLELQLNSNLDKRPDPETNPVEDERG